MRASHPFGRSRSRSVVLGVRRPDVGALVEAGVADQLVDASDDPRGIADDHHAVRHVVHHHGAGADERVLADHDPGQDRRVRADPGEPAHGGPATALGVAGTAHRVWVVGERHVGADKDVVFDGDQLEEAPRVDAHPVADAVAELQHGVGPDRHVIAEHVVFSDRRALTRLQALADRAAGVHRGERPDRRVAADAELTLAEGGTARRLCPGCREAEDRSPRPAAHPVLSALPRGSASSSRPQRLAAQMGRAVSDDTTTLVRHARSVIERSLRGLERRHD